MVAALTTLANVKSWGSIENPTDDALLTRLIEAASAYIATWCSREFGVADATEEHDGHGRSSITTFGYPILSVSSVQIDGVEVPASAGYGSIGYLFDEVSIMLRGRTYSRGQRNVRLAYRYGYQTVPADLEQACVEMVLSRYRERQRVGMQSQAMHGETVSFDPARLSVWARTVLQQYKRVVPL